MPHAASGPHALDPAARLLAEVYACVLPYPLRAERVQTVLAAAGLDPGLDKAEIGRLTEALIEAGFAVRREGVGANANPGVAARPQHALALLRGALAGGRLMPLLEALFQTREEYSHDDVEHKAMLRGSLLAADDDRFAQARSSYRRADLDWSFLAEPFVPEMIARLSAADRNRCRRRWQG